MNYKETVIPIVREVRGIVLPNFGLANITDEKSKHPADVVTETDIKVEAFLKEKLAKAFPDIEFVGEEGQGNREAKRFWLVDPIDGTALYIRGMPFCTTMLALIEDGVVNFSVIYDFVGDNMYWAERGKGAYMNDSRIYVSNRKLEKGYVCMETKYPEKEENLKKLLAITKLGYFHSINAGWEFAMVASGKLDARVAFDAFGRDYDFAPGSLLVSEAGGVITNIGSGDYDYKNTDFIAGNPVIYQELKDLFADYKKPK
jgi:myo-inositol-1(or 4)-monophosphatase